MLAADVVLIFALAAPRWALAASGGLALAAIRSGGYAGNGAE